MAHINEETRDIKHDSLSFPKIAENINLSEVKCKCFFCLNDITPTTIKTENDIGGLTGCNNHSLIFPLRNISRFLKFNGVEGRMSEKGIVEICDECLKLAKEFTELYMAFEEIQLRMQWCLRRICGVMQDAEKEKLNGEDSSVILTDEFAALRKITIQNGLKKIGEAASPLVSVKRIQLPSQESYPSEDEAFEEEEDVTFPPSPDSDGSIVFICEKKAESPVPRCDDDSVLLPHHPQENGHREDNPGPQIHLDADIIDIDNDNSSRAEAEVGTPLPSTPNHLQELEQQVQQLGPVPSSPSLSEDNLSCPFCRAVFKVSHLPPHLQQSHLSGHIMQHHCEHHFSNQKLDNVNPAQYQQILKDLLFRDICVKRLNYYNCPWCVKSYKSETDHNSASDLVRFKFHLLNQHRKELDERLLRIQKDPNLNEKLQTCGGISCKCGDYLPDVRNYNSHRMYYCTAVTPLSGQEPEPVTRNGEVSPLRNGNGRLSDSSGAMRESPLANKRGSDPEPQFPFRSHNNPQEHPQALPKPKISLYSQTPSHLSQQPNEYSHKGNLPSNSVPNRNGTRNHAPSPQPIAWNHHPTMKPSNVRENASLPCQNGSSSNVNVQPSTSHPTASASTYDQNNLPCSYCRATFPSGSEPGSTSTQQNLLITHMFQYHVKHYFPNKKLDAITDSQYQQILADLLFRDISFENNQFKCPWCPLSFVSKKVEYRAIHLVHLKLHLVDEHRKEMDHRLLLLQKDPGLRDKLKINSAGVLCECGIYLSNKSLETTHRKYHCTNMDSTKMTSWELELRKNANSCNTSTSKDSTEDGKRVQCSYCKMKVATYKSGRGLRMHHIKYHMEHFFPNSRKKEFITKKEFQKILVGSLFSEYVKKNTFKCKFCRKRFGACSVTRRPINIKDHYLEKHYEILRKKLRSLQKDPCSKEAVQTSNPLGRSPKSIPVTRQERRKNAYSQNAANLVKRSRKIMTDVKPDICPYCKLAMSTSPKDCLRLHMLRFHMEHFFPNERKEELVSVAQFKQIVADLLFKDFIRKHGKKCKLCRERFESRSGSSTQSTVNIKDHFLTKHYDTLKRKLDSIQNDPELAQKLSNSNPSGVECSCGAYLANEFIRKRHQERCKCSLITQTPIIKNRESIPTNRNGIIPVNGIRQCKTNDKRKPYACIKEKVCPYCKMNHAQLVSLKKHLIFFHSEHFFPNARNEAVVSAEQFQKIVSDMLFMHFIQENDTNCRICGKMFRSRDTYQRSTCLKEHLISKHYDVLKQKLDSIQKEPDLADKLSVVNPNSTICSCGAYLRNDRSRRLHQFYTKCQTINDTSATTGVTSLSRSHCPNELELQQRQWSCDRCGYIFFFKEMLEGHQKNECMQAFPSVTYMSDCPNQVMSSESIGVQDAHNNIQGFSWRNGNDGFQWIS